MQGIEIEWMYSLLLHSVSGKVRGSVWRDGNVVYQFLVWMQTWDDFVVEIEDCFAQGHGQLKVYRGERTEVNRCLAQHGASVDDHSMWSVVR